MEARERERERQTGLKGEGRSFEDGDMELVRDERGSETGHSCFIGNISALATTEVERRRWQAMEQAIYEKEAKNEDEVNDIHGGYRILPARSHLRLPCLLLSLLRPPPSLFLLHLCPARSNTFPFRKLRASFDPHERTTYTCVYITRSTALDVFRYILLGYRFLRVKHVFDNVLSPIFALDVSLLINPESRVKGSRLSRLDKGVARVPILYVGCRDLSTV